MSGEPLGTSPRPWRWAGWAAAAAGLVLVIGVSQWRAGAEVELALSFLERARRGQDVTGLVAPSIATALASDAPARPVEVIRGARAFTGAQALAVGWGERCVRADAVGTSLTPIWIELTEGADGFRVSGLFVEPPNGGPCSSD